MSKATDDLEQTIHLLEETIEAARQNLEHARAALRIAKMRERQKGNKP